MLMIPRREFRNRDSKPLWLSPAMAAIEICGIHRISIDEVYEMVVIDNLRIMTRDELLHIWQIRESYKEIYKEGI